MDMFLEICLVLAVYIIYRLYDLWEEKHPIVFVKNGRLTIRRRVKSFKNIVITIYGNRKTNPSTDSEFVIHKRPGR